MVNEKLENTADVGAVSGDGAHALAADRDLAARCAQGEARAIEQLYRTHVDRVQGLLYRILGADPELDDVRQTVFIEVTKSMASYRGESKLSTWIHRIAVRTAMHHVRRRRARPPAEDIDMSPQASHEAGPERSAAAAQMLERVHAHLEHIKPKKREAFCMVALEGLSTTEAAAILGESVATVSARVIAARRELMERLEKEGRRRAKPGEDGGS
jgi:RNA polymerase sigma-70 factor (ECF subfamily)